MLVGTTESDGSHTGANPDAVASVIPAAVRPSAHFDENVPS